MKKYLFLVAAACGALVACKKESGNGGRLDPNATVALNPAPGVKVYDPENPAHLTARQIVEQANAIFFNGQEIMGIDDWNRDLERNRIVMSSTWVVSQDGTLNTRTLALREHILTTLDQENHPVDTIAYIPNGVMQNLEQRITAAYDAGDYATCYRLFKEGFVFTPITGAEWLELKAEGKN
ncbi:hypothetical protein [uncultured Rikenella sp.]|uniref:hypothetical protein n=1 Tax=uncultured Rikenella sp. TaxID=368003 RepID=UPI00262326CC|nr:hypothetical protein [uncultured Rikenella sp.]